MGRAMAGVRVVAASVAAAAVLSVADGWRQPPVIEVVPSSGAAVPAAADTAPAAPAGEVAATEQATERVAATPTTVVVPVTTPAAPAAPAPVPNVQERGRAALALIPFDVSRTGYGLSFDGHRNGYLGVTSTTQKTITIYVRSTQTTREIAKVIAHEIGHAIDVEFTTESERRIYRQIRGIDDRPWYPDCSGCTDYDSVAGDFAETFAMAMVGDVDFQSTVAPLPTTVQLQALASLFTI